jgi:hypothetical protein
MQIAQIIQVLAVSQWEEDAKEKDLYERFEKVYNIHLYIYIYIADVVEWLLWT